MISYIYILNKKKKKNWGDRHPHFGQGQGTISDIYSNHRKHFMKYIKPQGYILKNKLCLSNKHLAIFWVILIGHAYNFVFPIVTHD
jgi:hypothetical protein